MSVRQQGVRRPPGPSAGRGPSTNVVVDEVRSLAEKRFTSAYIGEAEQNATKAAVLAGYSPKNARSMGYKLLRRVRIRVEIEHERTRISKDLQMSVDRVAQELARIGLRTSENCSSARLPPPSRQQVGTRADD